MADDTTTLEQQMQDYRQAHQDILKRYRYFYEMLRGALVVGFFAFIGIFLFTQDLLPEYWANVYVTVVGAIATIAILDRRNEERLTQRRKRELMLQLGSQSNDFALEAKRLLEIEGWWDEALAQKQFPKADWSRMTLAGADLTDASLLGATLTDAYLQEARLTNADLRGAALTSAHLFGATLTNADLSSATLTNADLLFAMLANAKLWRATLTDANLSGTTLTNAILEGATLTNAKLSLAALTEADLTGATLTGADLLHADLTDAYFNTATILPDGNYWTPDTDMARFTDWDYPGGFWRSDDPASPASYRGWR